MRNDKCSGKVSVKVKTPLSRFVVDLCIMLLTIFTPILVYAFLFSS